MNKIKYFILIIILILINLYQIFINYSIKAKINSLNETSDLINTQFPINLIKLQIEPEDTLLKKKQYKLFYLFSMQDCQQCLKNEYSEFLLKLQSKFNKILSIHIICIDSIPKNIYLFYELYEPVKFFLYSSSPNLLKTIKITNFPAIIFTDFNNIIKKVHFHKLDNIVYRKKCYIKIYGILCSNNDQQNIVSY